MSPGKTKMCGLKEGQESRIVYLDGLRGIAIILVTLFHAYARWPEFVPYGSKYSDFLLAKYGWLGVELFFMISGFVIYMTLEKCDTFGEFIWRRWLRLFPAMLVVSLLIYLTAGIFRERPAGFPVFQDLLPGLLFIEPGLISKVFGIKQGILEGAFWSLFVEVKFYFIFGIAFYAVGRERAKNILGIGFTLSVVAVGMNHFFHFYILGKISSILNGLLSFNYFGWFLIGVLVFELQKKHDIFKLLIICSLGIFTAWYSGIHRNDYTSIFSLFLIIIFVSAVYSRLLRKILSLDVLIFIGFVSYPFYLFHENFMIAVIKKIWNHLDPIPYIFLPIIPIIFVIFIAYLLAKFFEPTMRGWFRVFGAKVTSIVGYAFYIRG